MEHRWGRRFVTAIPVRLKCLQSPDSGCRCLGRLESISAIGALIKTEHGIRPSTTIEVQVLTRTGEKLRELPASLVRTSPGELSVEWTDFGSAEVFSVLAETALGSSANGQPVPALGRVAFCARASAMRPGSGTKPRQ